MNLLILPGNSPGNRAWAQSLLELFTPHFAEVRIIEYESWKTNDFEKIVDLDQEMMKVSYATKGWDSYCVLAKSVGTALCLKAVHEKIIKPEKCVLIGIPLDWLTTNNIPINKWTSTYSIPSLVIQQEDDPFANSKKVGKFLKDLSAIDQYLVVEGSDHKYIQVDEITTKSLDFFK